MVGYVQHLKFGKIEDGNNIEEVNVFKIGDFINGIWIIVQEYYLFLEIRYIKYTKT